MAITDEPEDFSEPLEFLRAVTESTEQLDVYLAQHPDASTAKRADALHRLAVAALKAGELNLASIASAVGGSINVGLGRLDKALEDREINLQVRYQAATTGSEYEPVHDDFLDLAARAVDLGDDKRALSAACLAIQAGYFGAQAETTPAAKERWIVRAMSDLINELRRHPSPMPAADATMLMEFAFAPLDEATSVAWMDQTTMDVLLREVAGQIEARIPPDAPLASDPTRDAGIAAVLSRLPSPGG